MPLSPSSVLDDTGKPIKVDSLGLPVTHSGEFFDHMAVVKAEAIYTASGGGQMLFSTEQSLPVMPGWLRYNRLRARAAKGVGVGPVVVAVSFAGGKVFGDLPPHEAFPIGGTNSVRGYDEGAVGSGRDYVVGSAELQVPLVQPLEGVVFVDVGSDLGTGTMVQGNPAGARGKPGTGHGAGVGVRVDTPIGPLRLELAWNDHGKARTVSSLTAERKALQMGSLDKCMLRFCSVVYTDAFLFFNSISASASGFDSCSEYARSLRVSE